MSCRRRGRGERGWDELAAWWKQIGAKFRRDGQYSERPPVKKREKLWRCVQKHTLCKVFHYCLSNACLFNYIKILESDWSSAALIWAVIVQLHTSCTWNCTVVRVMPEDSTRHQARASCTWMGSFSASSAEVEYINLSNSLYHRHILLEFYYSYD